MSEMVAPHAPVVMRGGQLGVWVECECGWVGPGHYTESGALLAHARHVDRLGAAAFGEPDPDIALYMAHARELVSSTQFGSVTMLQRRLGVGFAKACRVMERLELERYVEVRSGPGVRAVLVSAEEHQRRVAGASS